jgi:2-polyprenyl-3-methyl-5-hydroxy-6-metoxy-1,4-benzoquinol methylase
MEIFAQIFSIVWKFFGEIFHSMEISNKVFTGHGIFGIVRGMECSPESPAREDADVETASASYAARFAGPVGAWMLARQERLVLSALRAADARTVLDVGGGHGQLARPMSDAGYDVTVLGSEAICAERISDLLSAGRCRFDVGSVVDLPYPDASFDAVVSVRLLPHCVRWRQLVREMTRVARRVVIVDYPVKIGINALAPWLFSAKRKVEKNTRAWRNFTHEEVAREFSTAGFIRASRCGQFCCPMVLHRALNHVSLSIAIEWLPDRLGITRRFGTPCIASFSRKSV